MTEHLPDVELTEEQEARADAITAELYAPPTLSIRRAARLIIHLQDESASLANDCNDKDITIGELRAELAEAQNLLNSDWFQRVTYKQQLRAVLDDAERWRMYLKCYDQEAMVEAEWDGPSGITAYIDQQRATSTTGDAQK